MKYAPLTLAVTFWVLTAAHAATAATPPANLVDCSQMADPGERLKCYDTQMAAMKAAAGRSAASPPSVNVPPPAAAAPKAPAAAAASAAPKNNVAPAAAAPPEPTPDEKFGAVDLPREAQAKVVPREKALVSTIGSIRQVRPKLWLISLANGQVWLQDGTQITMFFRPGYDVRIERGLLEGDYRMSTTQTGAKNWVHVSRVQ